MADETVLEKDVSPVIVDEDGVIQDPAAALDIYKPRESAHFQALDELDEEQIVAYVSGDAGVMSEMFYSFTQGGQDIVGIAWAGVKAISNQLREQGRPIAMSELDITQDEENWYATVRAECLGESYYGVCDMPKKDEKGRLNKFAYRIVVSKAQRNAACCLIPAQTVKELYRKYVANGGAKAKLPSPATYPRRDQPEVAPKSEETTPNGNGHKELSNSEKDGNGLWWLTERGVIVALKREDAGEVNAKLLVMHEKNKGIASLAYTQTIAARLALACGGKGAPFEEQVETLQAGDNPASLRDFLVSILASGRIWTDKARGCQLRVKQVLERDGLPF